MPPAPRRRRDEPSSSSDSSSSDDASSSTSGTSSETDSSEDSSSGSDSETTTTTTRTGTTTTTSGTTSSGTTGTTTSGTSQTESSIGKRKVSFMPTPLNDASSGGSSDSSTSSDDDDGATSETPTTSTATTSTSASTSATTTTATASVTGDGRRPRRKANDVTSEDEEESTSDEETQSETNTTTDTASTTTGTTTATASTTATTTATGTSATTALTSATGSTVPRRGKPHQHRRPPTATTTATATNDDATTTSSSSDEEDSDDGTESTASTTTTTNTTTATDTTATESSSHRDVFERAIHAKNLETESSVDLRSTKSILAAEGGTALNANPPPIPIINIPKPPPPKSPQGSHSASFGTQQVPGDIKGSVDGFDSQPPTPTTSTISGGPKPPSFRRANEEISDDNAAAPRSPRTPRDKPREKRHSQRVAATRGAKGDAEGHLMLPDDSNAHPNVSSATMAPDNGLLSTLHGEDSQIDHPVVDDSIISRDSDDIPRGAMGSIDIAPAGRHDVKPLRQPIVVSQASLPGVSEHQLASHMGDENVGMAIVVRDRAVHNAVDALSSEAAVYERREHPKTPTPRLVRRPSGGQPRRYADDASSADGGSSVKRRPSAFDEDLIKSGLDDNGDGGSTIASSPDESFINDVSPTRPGTSLASDLNPPRAAELRPAPKPAPKKVITRFIRDTIGVSAQTVQQHFEPLPGWFMIEYGSPQDYIARLLNEQLALQEKAEEGQPQEVRCPQGRLSKANVMTVLRAFEMDDRKVKELTMTLGPHASLGDVQNLLEEETLTLTAQALEKAFHKVDSCRSGEMTAFDANRVLINSGIANTEIGGKKLSVRLGMFRRSLGVSIQQFADKPEFFDMGPNSGFRVNSPQGSRNVVVNDSFVISDLTSSEREQTLLALNAAVYVRKVVDQVTLADNCVEYDAILRNLLCHTAGWSKTTAVSQKRKSFFRERLIEGSLKPASLIEAIRNRSLPPFLLRTIKSKESHHFNFMPEIRVDKAEGTAYLEKNLEDSTKKHVTVKINEIRLPGEEIPVGSALYLLASAISEGQEVLPALRLDACPQSKPSDVWTFPKDLNTIVVYGNRSDIVYLEMCYDVQGEPRTAGFSSITLEKAKEGATALWVTGGTIYQPHRKRNATEPTSSCFCMTGPPPVHILVEFGKPKSAALAHFDPAIYPSRFICNEVHYALVGQCRQAIFDRLSDSPHVLHVVRDIYVRKSLSVTEDSSLMSVFGEIWGKFQKKLTKDQRKDARFVRQQLLLLMNRVAAARNVVVNPQEIARVVSGENTVHLQPNAPLKPVHSDGRASISAKAFEL